MSSNIESLTVATPGSNQGFLRKEANSRRFDAAEVWQARTDLAACFRAAAQAGFAEGVCNHFSAVVPGFDDVFLVNPYGLAFAEMRASDLLICDFQGRVLDGAGVPEDTAFFIHSRLHAKLPRARVAFHTHMPYATALCALQGDPLLWTGQNALRFYGRIAIDENYNGLALNNTEGDRIASVAGEADIVFLKNHGVMVLAPTIEEAWDDLYYLERACQSQVLAQSTGQPLKPVDPGIAGKTSGQFAKYRQPAARAHLDSVKRQFDRACPDYCT